MWVWFRLCDVTVSFGSSLFMSDRFAFYCRGLLIASVAACVSLAVGACADQTPPSVTDLPTSVRVPEAQSSESGAQKITADVVMSGGYEVAPNGKLLRPKDPSVVLPPLPDAATEFSEEGAYAFSEYWLDTLAYAWNTGKNEPIKNISDPECGACADMAGKISRVNDRGDWIRGMDYEMGETVKKVKVTDNLWAFVLELKTKEHTAYKGGEIISREEEVQLIEFQPYWVEDHWMMYGIVVSDDTP